MTEVLIIITEEGLMINAAEDAELIQLLEALIGPDESVIIGQTWCG